MLSLINKADFHTIIGSQIGDANNTTNAVRIQSDTNRIAFANPTVSFLIIVYNALNLIIVSVACPVYSRHYFVVPNDYLFRVVVPELVGVIVRADN